MFAVPYRSATEKPWRFIIVCSLARRPARSFAKSISLTLGMRSVDARTRLGMVGLLLRCLACVGRVRQARAGGSTRQLVARIVDVSRRARRGRCDDQAADRGSSMPSYPHVMEPKWQQIRERD